MNPPLASDLDQEVGASAKTGRLRRRRPRSGRRWWKRGPFRIAGALFLMFVLWLCWSLGGYLTAPGGDSFAARLAEWARDHHLGAIVTVLESAPSTAPTPQVGGTPTIALKPPGVAAAPQAPAAPATSTATPTVSTAATPTPSIPATSAPPYVYPARLVSPAGVPLPNEGTWQTLGRVGGVPALVGTYLRPDAAHTSSVASVVSMDPKLLRYELHPGTSDPGGSNWGTPPSIPPGSRNGLLATFNGGFKVSQSGGGFFLNGVTRGTLTPNIASLVFHKDGHVAVGLWGRDVGMSPDVVGVRQNLHLLVDRSTVSGAVDSHVQSTWGLTIGGKDFVWRSGIGVTADGRIVFVYGSALSPRTLADLLHQAGCVEAMQLDINPAWMSFQYYTPAPDPANPTPTALLSAQVRPANRYYEPTSRDFVAVFAR